MKHPVREMMETDAYTCHYTQTLGDVVRILVNKKIGGIPILDDDRYVMGFISDGDIMKAVAKQGTLSVLIGDTAVVVNDNEAFEEKVADLMSRNVMELATRKVIWVTPEQPVDEVAKILSKKRIKKVPVLEKGKLVGVISRSTIMRDIFQRLFHIAPEDE